MIPVEFYTHTPVSHCTEFIRTKLLLKFKQKPEPTWILRCMCEWSALMNYLAETQRSFISTVNVCVCDRSGARVDRWRESATLKTWSSGSQMMRRMKILQDPNLLLPHLNKLCVHTHNFSLIGLFVSVTCFCCVESFFSRPPSMCLCVC